MISKMMVAGPEDNDVAFISAHSSDIAANISSLFHDVFKKT